MEKSLERELDRIHHKLDSIDRKLVNQLGRVTKIETTQRGVITILTLVVTTTVSAAIKFFS